MEIDSRVRSVARDLCDVDLLSKLSTSDMVALGTKYHSSCLAALYNLARRHSKGRLSQENGQCTYHSIALAELISEIQNSKTEEPRTTVFKLSDLRKEFSKRLKLQGVTAKKPRDTPYASKGEAYRSYPWIMVSWSAYHGERQQHVNTRCQSSLLTNFFYRMCSFSSYDKACHNCCYESSGTLQPRTNCS